MAVSKYSNLEPVVLPKGATRKAFKRQIPVHLALLPSQLLSAIYYVVTQVALANGFSPMVLSLYRDVLAMITLAPIAYYADRGNRIELSWDVLRQLVLLGFTGIFCSNYLLFLGIHYTSADFSSGLQPAAPVATALIAVVFGVEKVLWHRRDGQAKVLGVVSCCAGAVLMTFWHGPAIIETFYSLGDGSLLQLAKSLQTMTFSEMGNVVRAWRPRDSVLGLLCLLGNSFAMGTFLNLQSKLLKKYPAPVSALTYAYFFGTLFMGLTCAIRVRDPSFYALAWDSTTAVVLYNGVIASALNFVLISWPLTRVGPLFVASYINLQPPITHLFSVICLGTTLYLGSILGTTLILFGLFLASWSWAREDSIRQVALDLPTCNVDALKEPLMKGREDQLHKTSVYEQNSHDSLLN